MLNHDEGRQEGRCEFGRRFAVFEWFVRSPAKKFFVSFEDRNQQITNGLLEA
jgi:hypothetical protein